MYQTNAISGDTASFTWYGAFRDAAQEKAFRTHALPEDRQMLYLGAWVLFVGVAAFVLNDLRVLSQGNPLPHVALAGRALMLVCVLVSIELVRWVKEPSALDVLTFGLVVLLTAQTYISNATRPVDYFVHIGVDIVILMAIIMVAPMTVWLRLFSGAGFSVGLLIMHFMYKAAPNRLTDISVVLAILLANLIGIITEVRLARSRRAEYLRLKGEEQAIAEVQMLAGLIPICASCKKVRNDEGYWEQVESYVHKHSKATFSHSICPHCAEKLYGISIGSEREGPRDS